MVAVATVPVLGYCIICAKKFLKRILEKKK
jgi:hypothetical protein